MLGLCTTTSGGTDSTPGRGTKIPMLYPMAKNEKITTTTTKTEQTKGKCLLRKESKKNSKTRGKCLQLYI